MTEARQMVADLFGLSKEDQAGLSKALFPEIDTREVTICGIKRSIRPVPIKYSKRLKELITPIAEKLTAALNNPTDATPVHVDDEILAGLTYASTVLAEFYGWADVAKAIADEDITTAELQALCAAQLSLQESNDFLLGPLRIVMLIQQQHEVGMIQFRNMLTGQPSSNSVTPTLTE